MRAFDEDKHPLKDSLLVASASVIPVGIEATTRSPGVEGYVIGGIIGAASLLPLVSKVPAIRQALSSNDQEIGVEEIDSP